MSKKVVEKKLKVIFLQGQNVKLQDILEKLKVEVLIAENDPTDFIEEWQADDSVVVFHSNLFSEAVDHICKGLDLYTDAYKFIANNFTQNQMNDLTFSDVEYVKELKKPDAYQQMVNRITRTEGRRILRAWEPIVLGGN